MPAGENNQPKRPEVAAAQAPASFSVTSGSLSPTQASTGQVSRGPGDGRYVSLAR